MKQRTLQLLSLLLRRSRFAVEFETERCDEMNSLNDLFPSLMTDRKARLLPLSSQHHVIFVIHGIGQRYDRFIANIESLKKNIQQFQASKSSDSSPTPELHLIPIDWHYKLHALDTVDARMRSITLPTVPYMRVINNDYLADLIYYLTEAHGPVIMQILVDAMNSFYTEWKSQHPNSQFSIIGHSLGGIISHDLLIANDSDERRNERKLLFRPRFLFTFGSPIAAVMVMRGHYYETFRLPEDILLFNIFHPYDPIAYRLEPLIDERYSDIEPAVLAHWDQKRLHLVLRDHLASVLPDLSQFVPAQVLSLLTQAKGVISSQLSNNRSPEGANDIINLRRHDGVSTSINGDENNYDVVTNFQPSGRPSMFQMSGEEVPVFGSPPLSPNVIASGTEEYFTLDTIPRRLDYMLQVNALERVGHEYLGGYPAHFSYWSHADLALAVLNIVSGDEFVQD